MIKTLSKCFNLIIRLSVVLYLLTGIYACSSGCNDAVSFYVSPDGDDGATGSTDAPFRTPERARDAVRALKQANGLPRGGITVYFRKGIYPVEHTVSFTADDSGTEKSPIIYRACPDEEVRFTGGRAVTNFEPLTDPEALSRIAKVYHPHIFQADLNSLGITDYGTLKPTGFGRKIEPSAMELFFNGQPMTLARYPNDNEWMHIASVPQTGDSIFGGDERTGRGVHRGRFAYQENRPSKWLKNDDIWLQGFWTWDWADSYVKVGRIDAARKEFILQPPHGVYGYSPEQRYYALNIMEELDSPGEWFLDRKKGILYFWPPSPIEEGDAQVSLLEEQMFHFAHTKHLRFEGFIFEYTRGDVIKTDEVSHTVFAGCTIRNIGNNAIHVNGGHHCGVTDCDLFNIGDNCIILKGGDRKTLTPACHYAINNHIHHYSRLNRTYCCAIVLDGVGNTMAHNHIHDAPHMAVLFPGNNHILEYNEIHHTAQETGDVGAFYIGRDWTQRGSVIRFNYFHDLAGPGLYGVNAVYLDDFACGTTICGNIFCRAGRGAFVGGGHDNLVENNVFIDCAASIHLDARGVNWAYMYFDTNRELFEKLEEMDYKQPPYSEQYPELTHILDRNPAQPRGNIFRSNLSYGGKWREIEDDVDEMTIEDNLIFREIPSYVKIDQWELYPEDESLLEKIHFRKIPVDSIGLKVSAYRKTLPSDY